MDLREKFAELSTPKKVAVVGGVGVVLFVVFKKLAGASTASTVSASDYTQDIGTIGGTTGTSSGGSSGGSSSGGIDTSTDINQQSQIDQLYNKINDLTNQLHDTQTATAGTIDALQKTATTATNEANFSKALDSTPSIYADKIDDASQYKNIVDSINSAVSSGDLTATQGKQAAQKIAGYGNNGQISDGQTYANVPAILSDAGLVASEQERTAAVIANRQAAGMNVDAQNAWQERLTVGYGNNGVAAPNAAPAPSLAQVQSSGAVQAAEVARTQAVIANRQAAGMDTSNQMAWLAKITGRTA